MRVGNFYLLCKKKKDWDYLYKLIFCRNLCYVHQNNLCISYLLNYARKVGKNEE